MIGRLKGTLVHKQPPWLVVDVHGVGYELEAPMSTFYDLPEAGREVSLFTHYAQKEDSVSLYGFLRESERRLFRDVQKVSGIGAKISLAVLSGAHPYSRHRQEDRRAHGRRVAGSRRRFFRWSGQHRHAGRSAVRSRERVAATGLQAG